MMINSEVVELSRLQFAITALYHFLFVPLTIGLSWILVIMESVYVMTNKSIYLQMVKFWGKIFGINFALGVATGIVLEFEFGTNWSYYSYFVGDIFGASLAAEGLIAFFLESTMIGLFIFGWHKLSRVGHLLVTVLMALGSNLSALMILIANGWMQNPRGADFNPFTFRMELTNVHEVIFNPTAQDKFIHTLGACYTTASLFVLGVASWYLLNNRYTELARRSFRIAATFGLTGILCTILLGDESGYTVSEDQKSKMASMEAIWRTEAPPAGLKIMADINEKEQKNDWSVEIPYILGMMGTRSLDTPIPGMLDIIDQNKNRIRSGMQAVIALEELKNNNQSEEAKILFNLHKKDLGYGLLVKKYTDDVRYASTDIINKAANDTIPSPVILFWSFRTMVSLGLAMLIIFGLAFWYSINNEFTQKKWLLKSIIIFMPAPWIAAEMGWIVTEYGRQPWTVFGILPTYLSASSLSIQDVLSSLVGFILFYSILLIIDVFLIVKVVRKGPSLA